MVHHPRLLFPSTLYRPPVYTPRPGTSVHPTVCSTVTLLQLSVKQTVGLKVRHGTDCPDVHRTVQSFNNF